MTDKYSVSSNLVDELRRANVRGVAPPQNWTHRAIDEIERLTRLLNARPPYYCQNCDCASCGNTRPAVETTTPTEALAHKVGVVLRQNDWTLSLDAIAAVIEALSVVQGSPEEPTPPPPTPWPGSNPNKRGDLDEPLRPSEKASAPVYSCPVTHVDCIRNCAPTRCAIADTP